MYFFFFWEFKKKNPNYFCFVLDKIIFLLDNNGTCSNVDQAKHTSANTTTLTPWTLYRSPLMSRLLALAEPSSPSRGSYASGTLAAAHGIKSVRASQGVPEKNSTFSRLGVANPDTSFAVLSGGPRRYALGSHTTHHSVILTSM